jgi:inorganic pyrophosphatase
MSNRRATLSESSALVMAPSLHSGSVVSRTITSRLHELTAWDENGQLRIVVETPRGSAFKLHYDMLTEAFTLQRFLAGTHYPYDWGFIPGTCADDGDPLDAMVIHDGATWPGVIIPSVPIAVLKLCDRKPNQAEQRNDRIIAVPCAARDSAESALTATRCGYLQEFFVATGQLTKKVRVLGWGDAAEARAIILQSAIAANRSSA